MPPARSTSSMWYGEDGETLQMFGRLLRELVDAVEVVRDAGLVRDGQRVQHGVGAAAHGHVEDEGVVERLARDDVARLEVFLHHLDDPLAGLAPELLALGVVGEDGAVAGQGRGRSPRTGSSWSWR